MYDLKHIIGQVNFVREVEWLKEEKKKYLLFRYSKIILVDYSVLYAKEIWRHNSLIKYSYYWFTADNKLISGWDNAPHHPEIETFPHHRHHKEVSPSNETNLPGVFEFIDKIFNMAS
jgi:hypothetical protein